jgi:hypothetical protein
MQNGSIVKVIHTTEEERSLALKVSQIDDVLTAMREKIRLGEVLVDADLEGLL